MATIYKVEGGISGSVHHRGPWYFATQEEAEACCARDVYRERESAAGPDVDLDWWPVTLPTDAVSTLERVASGHELTGEAESIYRRLRLIEYREGYPENTQAVSDLGRQVIAMHQ